MKIWIHAVVVLLLLSSCSTVPVEREMQSQRLANVAGEVRPIPFIRHR